MDGITFTYGYFLGLVTEVAQQEGIKIPDLFSASPDAKLLEDVSSLDLLNLVTGIEDALLAKFEAYDFADIGHVGSRTLKEIYEIFCSKLDMSPDYTAIPA